MSFPLGRVVATPALLAHMLSIGAVAQPYLVRHQNREWGNLSVTDKRANDQALIDGGRLLSKYMLPDRTPFWIITEADRSSTCLLFPHEY
jgi:hypothetical protein